MTSKQNVPLLYLIPGLFLCLSPGGLPGAPDSLKDLSQQIFDIMSHAPGAQPSQRAVHAKGLVCQGNFEPTNGAQISRAAHFRGGPVPVTVRFSDGAPDPAIPDRPNDAGRTEVLCLRIDDEVVNGRRRASAELFQMGQHRR